MEVPPTSDPEVPMLSLAERYPLALTWLQALGLPHATARAALAAPLSALLVGQSLHAAVLMRTLLSPSAVPARQRYKRLQRVLHRPWLTSAWLTPRLVRAALALVRAPGETPGAAREVVLALDSVRCGPWELYTLGLVWHGRALPLAWAVLPYPLPPGQFGPTVAGLVQRVAVAWPAAQPPPHLVADRAFPSQRLFRQVRTVGWGFTIRVRATDGVRVAGQATVVRELLQQAQPGCWTAPAATVGTSERAVPGTLVLGRGLEVFPPHQTGPASLLVRAARALRRERHLSRKKAGGAAAAGLRAADRWVALFSSQPAGDWQGATRRYGQRWAIEGSYRDALGGWDGRQGWGLVEAAARRRTGQEVDALVGLWALGALLQSWVGAQTTAPGTPVAVRAARRGWCTTERLSVWARGKFALTDPSGALRPWLQAVLAEGAARIRQGPERLPRARRSPHDLAPAA
jgi:hypothetical protein